MCRHGAVSGRNEKCSSTVACRHPRKDDTVAMMGCFVGLCEGKKKKKGTTTRTGEHDNSRDNENLLGLDVPRTTTNLLLYCAVYLFLFHATARVQPVGFPPVRGAARRSQGRGTGTTRKKSIPLAGGSVGTAGTGWGRGTNGKGAGRRWPRSGCGCFCCTGTPLRPHFSFRLASSLLCCFVSLLVGWCFVVVLVNVVPQVSRLSLLCVALCRLSLGGGCILCW